MQRSACHVMQGIVVAAILIAACLVPVSTAVAQATAGDSPPVPSAAPGQTDLVSAPAKVDVKPVSRDEDIRQRLQSVLDATEWFSDPQVRVQEGVVFLSGRAQSEELKKWAGDLAPQHTGRRRRGQPDGGAGTIDVGSAAGMARAAARCGATSSVRFRSSFSRCSSWCCRPARACCVTRGRGSCLRDPRAERAFFAT